MNTTMTIEKGDVAILRIKAQQGHEVQMSEVIQELTDRARTYLLGGRHSENETTHRKWTLRESKLEKL